MGKKSGPSAPAPPDPWETAAAQSQYNKEAAVAQANMNRIDQVTPQGSITYNQIGTNADGTPQYRQTQAYSPEQQALYTQQNQVAQALGGLAGQNIGRVQDAQSQSFNYDNMTPMVTGINGAGNVSQFNGSTPGVQRNVDTKPLQYTFDSGGNIQRGVGANDLSADAQRVAGSLYGQATSRLDPQFTQAQSDIEAKLTNSGIARGSEAWNRELDNFGRTKNDAYNDANFRAIQAGGAEQSRLFGLDMSQGQFANQAQAQQYAQNQSGAQFNNQAQDQNFSQGLGNAELYNNGGQMDLSQQLAALGFNNQAQSQSFNEQLANGGLTNNARQQQIQEATYLRNLPLNDIAALLGTGGGVQNPEFQQFAQVGVAAPDYQGAAYNTYNAQYQQYQAQQQARSSAMGSIFGLAGSLAPLAISDRRLKHNLVRIGTLANGLATFAFSYIGEKARQFGVMAQDVLAVRPDAVVTLSSGHLAVDYGKVW